MKKTCLYGLGGISALALIGLAEAPAHAQLIITPTYDSTITSLGNAAAVELEINSAISAEEALYSNNVDIKIQFSNMTGGLGQSEKFLFTVPYSTFRSAYAAEAVGPVMTAALASLPNTTNNPVTGTPNLFMGAANLRAMGIAGGAYQTFTDGYTGDGEIGLNLGLTDVDGGAYYLKSVVEHEMDEVMGFGSSLDESWQNTDPGPQDLYRYSSNGIRSYTTNSSAKAYFSYNGGATLPVQFDNQNDGGDWGDWQSNPLPGGVNPQVQDAFGTPGSTPSLGANEIDNELADGYTPFTSQAPAGTPEPGSVALFFSAGVIGLGAIRRKLARKV